MADMGTNQTDYLRYSAQSMKDLIILKLSENPNFTDQVFEDSNLTTLIDVFSVMYSTMGFYLNNTATNAIFTDAELYENMNRIVKMLGYNPRGFVTSTVQTDMSLIEGQSFTAIGLKTIPKYTTYDTGLTDTDGNQIKYSFVDSFSFVSSMTEIDSDYRPILYNGEWNLYSDTPVSVGIPFETFTLDKLTLDGDDKIYLAHNLIDVYFKKKNGEFLHYMPTTNLYNSIGTDLHFEVRLNENKQYTLKFGDSINGKKLESEGTLYIVYLKSNGSAGQIGAGSMDGTVPLEVSIIGLNETFIKTNILKVSENPEYILFGSDPDAELQKVTLTNSEASTYVKDFETVDEIRQNAPNWFRMGGRLITEQDFKQYILMSYPSEIYDVDIQNNWEYMVEFQQWLKAYDKLDVDIRHLNYEYSDSCDFNNIYIWLKSFNYSDVPKSTKKIIERDCDRLKPVTAELVMVDPLKTTFSPYVRGTYSTLDWDPNHENKIQLVRDRNTMITVERIKQRAVNSIQEFFALTNNNLGGTININDLYNTLSAIDGVKLVRMKYLATGSPESTAQYVNGISFAMWTQHLIDGQDLTKVSGNTRLKSFQFPVLLDSNTISNKIEVLSDLYNIQEVEY